MTDPSQIGIGGNPIKRLHAKRPCRSGAAGNQWATPLQFEADRVSVRETAAALSLSIRPTAPSDRAVFGLFVDPLDGANPNTLSSQNLNHYRTGR